MGDTSVDEWLHICNTLLESTEEKKKEDEKEDEKDEKDEKEEGKEEEGKEKGSEKESEKERDCDAERVEEETFLKVARKKTKDYEEFNIRVFEGTKSFIKHVHTRKIYVHKSATVADVETYVGGKYLGCFGVIEYPGFLKN